MYDFDRTSIDRLLKLKGIQIGNLAVTLKMSVYQIIAWQHSIVMPSMASLLKMMNAYEVEANFFFKKSDAHENKVNSMEIQL